MNTEARYFHTLKTCTDAELDLWNNAALAALRGQPCPASDTQSLAGYKHGIEERSRRVVMPSRPEGYYHAPIGTFD